MTIFSLCFARDSSYYLPFFLPVSFSQTLADVIRFHFFYRKIVELEEELRVVGNNLKSLEVSEEKVFHSLSRHIPFILNQQNFQTFYLSIYYIFKYFKLVLSSYKSKKKKETYGILCVCVSNVVTRLAHCPEIGQPTWGSLQGADQDAHDQDEAGRQSKKERKVITQHHMAHNFFVFVCGQGHERLF